MFLFDRALGLLPSYFLSVQQLSFLLPCRLNLSVTVCSLVPGSHIGGGNEWGTPEFNGRNGPGIGGRMTQADLLAGMLGPIDSHDDPG